MGQACWVLVILVLFLHSVRPAPPFSRPEKQRLCGLKLFNMLKKLCNHHFFTPTTSEHKVFGSSSWYRRKSGIVEACCNKPCGYNYLRSYCAVTTTTTNEPKTTDEGINRR